MQAQDVMTTSVISVAPETPVEEVAALLRDRHISAVPVVDADGVLLGMVSHSDLLRLLQGEGEDDRQPPWWLSLIASSDERAHDYLRSHGRTAGEIMSFPVVSVEPTTPVAEVARLLDTRRIKRVPVVDGSRVVGIVSRGDLLRALAVHRTASPVTTDDRELCRRVEERLSAAGLDWRHWVTVVVSDGRAHLWGVAASDDEALLLRRLAEEVAGDGRVESHLSVRSSEPHLRPGRYGLS
ncbi:MAG TPA: CBS domain-containing protein [Geminicoccaceae bacterium]|nr:CBS domain-containing protein [Geminicoccaceae bacterium]